MVGRILIVDGVATNRIVLRAKLVAACYAPVLAADGQSCLRMLQQDTPDLVILDFHLPDLSGPEVVRRLRARPGGRDISVIFLCADPGTEDRLAAFGAGADDILPRGTDDLTMLARVRSLLRARELSEAMRGSAGGMAVLGLAEPATLFDRSGQVALLTDRPERTLRLRKEIGSHSADRLVAMSRSEALAEGLGDVATAGAAKVGDVPDVFVIDADLGGVGGGLRLVSDLRSRSATRHAEIVLLLPEDPAGVAAMAYDLGANDLWGVGTGGREMALRLRRLMQRKRAADRLRSSVQDGLRLALIDPLTGLHNRRYAEPHLAGIAARARSSGAGYAVMIVDIDRFKVVNDRWGHAAGDAVLVEVARRLDSVLRESDLIARIGGEEFLVALPDTGLTEARITADRLCAVIEQTPIPLPGGAGLTVTVSIGLAISDGAVMREVPVASLVDQADRALLVAKAAGRNQVTVSRSAA